MKRYTIEKGALLVLCCTAVLAVSVCSTGGGQTNTRQDPGLPAGLGEGGFRKYFTYDPLKTERDALQYDLPLEARQVVDFDEAVSRLMIPQEARERILESGFVVTEFPYDHRGEQFDEAYMVLERRDVPVFVTSASLLHTYHIIFDHTLQRIEARNLYDRMWNLSMRLFDRCWRVYGESDGELKEAARRNAAFLATGLSLLKPDPEGDYLQVGRETRRGVDESGHVRVVEELVLPSGLAGADLGREFTNVDLGKYTFEVPPELSAEVRKEIDLVMAHAGFAPSPIFKYSEDYSQYLPRGHYTVSDKLKRYFRAMMWFGRMSMLLKGSEEIAPGSTCSTCDALISRYDARVQTIGACLLAGAMAESSDLLESWNKVYEVTSFFVGFSDDLGPYEYIAAMNVALGGTDRAAAIGEEAHGELKAKLAEYGAPRIYGGTGECTITPPFTPEQADECLAGTRGFRLIGQRYVPDSYIFSKLVAPYVGEFQGGRMPFTAYEIPGVGIGRVFPRGLDLLAVMGSDRALDVLDELGDANYENYSEAFREMHEEIGGLDEGDWNQNLYWNWLWVLRSLVSQHGKGYPAFMRSTAWQDRLLTTALASWAELRHDTILYAKQSYTMALTAAPPPPQEPDRPMGFVEPVPEVYNRLLSLTRMMRLGLVDMGMIEEKEISAVSMNRLERTLERLVDISAKELSGRELDGADMDFIGDFGESIKGVLDGVDRDSQKTTLVADVHTDSNSGMVLEEGCGYVELIVVAWKNRSGIWLAAGPEMSYYEFKQPMANRLTDEAWRKVLELQKPALPPWTASYRR
jgi:hypothetical protein